MANRRSRDKGSFRSEMRQIAKSCEAHRRAKASPSAEQRVVKIEPRGRKPGLKALSGSPGIATPKSLNYYSKMCRGGKVK
jgi:hypothetical protein